MPVVEAAFVMHADQSLGHDERRHIEGLLIAEIEKANAEGVTDPEEIRRRILAARDRISAGG